MGDQSPLRRALSDASETSRIAAVLEPALDDSTTVDYVDSLIRDSRAVETIRGWLAALYDWSRTSIVGSAATGAVGIGTRVAGSASVVRTARGSARWATSSFVYRWLTKEPEPEVIVIDLRETLTVGPIIAALDRVLTVLLPAAARSRIARAAADTERYVRRAPVRTLGIVVFAATAVDLLVSVATAVTPTGFVLRLAVLVLAAAGTRVTLTWDELVRTRPVRLAVAALEPPDPEAWEDEDARDGEGRR